MKAENLTQIGWIYDRIFGHYFYEKPIPCDQCGSEGFLVKLEDETLTCKHCGAIYPLTLEP